MKAKGESSKGNVSMIRSLGEIILIIEDFSKFDFL